MSEERPKVRERPDTDEDEERKEAVRDPARVDDPEEALRPRNVGARDVREQSAETDRDEEQRLEATTDPEIEQQQTDRDHHELPNGREIRDPRGRPDLRE